MAVKPVFFLSYRRVDQLVEAAAHRVRSWLDLRFGQNSTYVDTASNVSGDDWRDVIEGGVRNCVVFCPLIGPKWEFQFKQVPEDDIVRYEIERAFELGKSIHPILIGRAEMPEANGESIKERLLEIQAISISLKRDFDTAMQRFLGDLTKRGVIVDRLLRCWLHDVYEALRRRSYTEARVRLSQLPFILKEKQETVLARALVAMELSPRDLHRGVVEDILRLLEQIGGDSGDKTVKGQAALVEAYLKEGAFCFHGLDEPGRSVGQLMREGCRLTSSEGRRELLSLLGDPSNAVYRKIAAKK